MICPRFSRTVCTSVLALLTILLPPIAHAQGAKKPLPETPIKDADADHEEQRSEWFLRGRVVPDKSSAELRRLAYQTKMQARAVRLARISASQLATMGLPASGNCNPLGPVPLASDATGTGFQDYHPVSGPATAVAIDPADATGNTVYIGGAQGVEVNQCNHQRRQQLDGTHRRPGHAFDRVDGDSTGEFQSQPKCNSGGHRRG